MKRLFGILLILAVCVCLFCTAVSADGASASMVGPDTVRAGNTITVTFYVSGTNVSGVNGKISYDKDLLTLEDTTQKIGSGWEVEFNGDTFIAYDNKMESPINSSTAIFALTFEVKSSVSTGEEIKVSCLDVTTSDGQKDTTVGTVTYTKKISRPLSSDNKLKSLTVSNASLSPSFNANTTFYSARVPYSVTKLEITAAANDSNARVSINNPYLEANGSTNVTVTVTAENGSTKTYTISVTRDQDPNYVKADENRLQSLTVEGFPVSPLFTPDNTNYIVWLPYEVEALEITGVPVDDKASYRVEGNENLKAGEDNEIKVTCIAEDGSELVYTVVAKRAAPHVTEPTEPEETIPEETVPEESVPEETVPETVPLETTEPTEQTEPTYQQITPVVMEEESAGGFGFGAIMILGTLVLLIGMTLGFLIGRKFPFNGE